MNKKYAAARIATMRQIANDIKDQKDKIEIASEKITNLANELLNIADEAEKCQT
jgi:hypothetical protein